MSDLIHFWRRGAKDSTILKMSSEPNVVHFYLGSNNMFWFITRFGNNMLYLEVSDILALLGPEQRLHVSANALSFVRFH